MLFTYLYLNSNNYFNFILKKGKKQTEQQKTEKEKLIINKIIEKENNTEVSESTTCLLS